MNNFKTKVLIIGGGFAGVKTALELSDNHDFEVSLMSPRTNFEYHGAMYRSATGRSPLEVVVPLREIFENKKNVTHVLDSMAELRVQTREVEGGSGRVYDYDILVIAVGYEVNYFGIEGMALHAETMYDIQQAIKLRHALVGAFRNATPETTVNVNVIGAGPTGVEVVSDISNFANLVAGRHGLKNLNVKARLIEASNRVLPIMSEESSKMALARLEELDVEVLLGTSVTRCNEASVVTSSGEFESDVTIWTAGNKAHSLFSSYPDIFSLDERSRVKVSEFFQANSPDIYVIGDAASTPYSGMAQTAIHNGEALAKNLIRHTEGESMTPYEPLKPKYVVPVGTEWAVLETDEGSVAGTEGWKARRDADKWILECFLVYDLAKKHLDEGDKIARF